MSKKKKIRYDRLVLVILLFILVVFLLVKAVSIFKAHLTVNNSESSVEVSSVINDSDSEDSNEELSSLDSVPDQENNEVYQKNKETLLEGMIEIPELDELLKCADFNFDLLPRYLLEIRNNNTDYQEAVRLVNENKDYIPSDQLDMSSYYTGDILIENPSSLTACVNKVYTLSSDYEPDDLVYLEEGYYGNYQPLRKEAAGAFMSLSIDAQNLGYSRIVAYSNYRSYETQKGIYERYVSNDGAALADTYSARAGHSEHQTGLVSDIAKVGDIYTSFDEYEGYQWALENAHKYGLIQRFPENKEYITGYVFESWHFRYVGIEAATIMDEHNWTLDEYALIFGYE